jgi:AraC-like DNA-binding protein
MIYSFKQPAAFFIPPLTSHALLSSNTFDGWIIQIPPLILDRYEGRPEFHFLADLIHRSSPALRFSKPVSAKIIETLEKAQTQSGVFRWFCILEAFYIAAEDQQVRRFSFQPERLGKPDILDEIINHLFNEFTGTHSLADLAKTAGMTVQRFCRHFKKRTGMTTVEYLHSVRINTAKKLLQQSKLYVDDICYEIGFNSISFFNRKFKEHTGITPLAYRRRFSGNGNEQEEKD